MTETKSKMRRGFAAMDRAAVSEISRKGGKAAHAAGTAHQFNTEEARAAGRLGGQKAHENARARKAAMAAKVESVTQQQ